MSSISEASSAFSSGTKMPLNPFLCAQAVVGRVPEIGRISPVKPSSPTKMYYWMFSGSAICSVACRIPRAIERSNRGPCFLRSAGARLTTTRPLGKVKPEFFIADLTRSLASWTAGAGGPTMMIFGRPLWMSTSTSTSSAWRPKREGFKEGEHGVGVKKLN